MSQCCLDPVPPDVEARLSAARGDGDQVVLRVRCDLDDRLAYTNRWLEVTTTTVALASDVAADPVVAISMSDIAAARFEPLVGGGRLVIARRSGASFRQYSSNHATHLLSEAAGAIQSLAGGQPVALPSRRLVSRCGQCGRLLPEAGGTCPSCVQTFVVLRRMLAYLRQHWPIAAALLVVTSGGSVAELLPPLIIQHIVDDILVVGRGWRPLAWLVVALMIARGAMWAAEVGRGWLGALLGARIVATLRSHLYRRLHTMSLHHFDERSVGATMARIISDVDRVEEFVVSAAPLLVTSVLLLAGVLGFLLVTSVRLTLYVLAPVPVIALAAKVSWAPVKDAWARQAIRWAQLSDRVSQSLAGIREVKAFGQERRESDAFDRDNAAFIDISVRGERLSFGFFSVLYLLMGLGPILVWYVGGNDVLAGKLSLGTLLAIVAYLWMLYWPLQWMGQIHQACVQALTGAERIFAVLDTPVEWAAEGSVARLPRIAGAVRYEGEAFGYDARRPVVHDITLDVAGGVWTAEVGRGGAGKTTLMNLVCRFYQPDAGRILVDGVDLRDVGVEEWRGQLAVVLQEPFLFSGSIAANIRYGRPAASFEEVLAAARAANAHEFIVAKEDGYDTEVGERGERLSGGERQRVAIARALLRDPRILILDEATASVDVYSEQLIRDAITRLSVGRTTFIIAHKLSTVRTADRFIVLDEGRVVEMGRYDDLIAQRGAFFHLVQSQLQGTRPFEMSHVPALS